LKTDLHFQVCQNIFNFDRIGFIRFSFICQRTSTRRQRRDLFSLRVKVSLVTLPV